MKKILVTGGMGFVGNHLVRRLLDDGHHVIVLDKSIYKPTFHNISEATIIEGDLLSKELVKTCLNEVDICFHLAAISSVALCARDWNFSHLNNVVTFNNILDTIRMLKKPIKLVYASSSAVYGDCEVLPLREDVRIRPTSTYGADKFANEMYADVMSHCLGITSIGLRFFNIYGAGQLASNPYSGVITNFKTAISLGKPITIFGDGLQTRDFIFINDIVEALLLASITPLDKTGIYNICTGHAISIVELAHLLIKVMGKTVPINFTDPRIGDLRHSLGNPALAEQELGFSAKTNMADGIDELIKQNTFFY